MLCDKCGLNEAQVHFKTEINGHIEEQHLCKDCSGEIFSWATMTAADLLGGPSGDPFAGMLGNLFAPSAKPEAKACPTCRKNIREISGSGRMGCSDCYGFFEEEISPYISRLHGTSAHAGKIPRSISPKLSASREITRLRNELTKAVESQEYEKAAKLRDEINTLEGGDSQ